MKILQVIHDFLPHHQAGSELYCFHLSKELQRLGRDVKLLFTEIDHQRPQYSLREGVYEDLPFIEIINNHQYGTFAQTYSNPVMDEIFLHVVDDYRPDVVHFHHLLGLSFGCVRICHEKNIPSVFTLHDYWLTCARGGGQRFRGPGKLCDDVDSSFCAECISSYSFPARAGQRLIKALLAPLERVDAPTLMPAMKNGTITVPVPSFYTTGVCQIHGDARQAVFAHPPCTIAFRQRIPPDAQLVFAVAMDPSTYGRPGDGVMFTIHGNGKRIYERFLNTKNKKEDRHWWNEQLSLKEFAGQTCELVFETTAYPNGHNEHCSACWAEPKIIRVSGEPFRRSLTSRFRSLAESLLATVQKSRLKGEADRRRKSAFQLFDEVDLFIAPSPFLRRKFIEYGLPSEKIVFSDYGIHALPREINPCVPKYPIRFAYVGTLVEHKGLHVLIEAFNGLPHGKATLDVYGSVNEFTGYVSRIQSMITHPGITLRGRAENNEIPRILSETDVLVVPSIWFENSPITIHEAFLARVPVITSRLGGMADLVQEKQNGLLFEVGNAADLQRRLLQCVESPAFIETIRPDPQTIKSTREDAMWMLDTYRALMAKRSKDRRVG
ncbi:MAG: glycosyltransferase [Candidatus Omnitrophota bacterium]|jgi:glycosyltransferase involved in cell wall biosynthesis|nr:MAG: glycosyltransferase [Candidatus Omnitrophota bacterium]